MESSKIAQSAGLEKALRLMREALELLDACEAPRGADAHLDMAIHCLLNEPALQTIAEAPEENIRARAASRGLSKKRTRKVFVH